ncbi:MAG TPA: hypothetical protein VLE89_00120 [Chlamydiales bacterium]|nr:hypothetical protein [Chlamydiales bacterium]
MTAIPSQKPPDVCDYYHPEPIVLEVKPFLLEDFSKIVADYATVRFKVWEDHYGAKPGQEPPLPNETDLQAMLESDCEFYPGKKTKETHDVLFIPETLNGEIFTHKKMGYLAQNPTKGNPLFPCITIAGVATTMGASPIGPSRVLLITKGTVPGSVSIDNLYNGRATDFFASHPKYRLPTGSEVVIHAMTQYVSKGEVLYPDNEKELYSAEKDPWQHPETWDIPRPLTWTSEYVESAGRVHEVAGKDDNGFYIGPYGIDDGHASVGMTMVRDITPKPSS